MSMKERKISSIEQFLKYLKDDIKDTREPVWFRGHYDASWKLIPSYYRAGFDGKNSERNLIDRFKQNAKLLVESNHVQTEMEWLFVMRHHGVPTRLLDWTESPLAALYFATGEKTEDGISYESQDSAVWLLFPTRLNMLASIKIGHGNIIPGFDSDYVKNYTPQAFEGEQSSSLSPLAFICPRNTPRMQAQLSVFSMHHRDKSAIEDLGSTQDHVIKYIIPKENKVELRRELSLLGINKFQLYPELASIGCMLKEGV